MAEINAAGSDLNLGTIVPASVNVNKNGWYEAYDNLTVDTLAIVLNTAKSRRDSVQKCIVTLGVTTAVTCPAAIALIGFGAGITAGDYLLTLETGINGVVGTLSAID